MTDTRNVIGTLLENDIPTGYRIIRLPLAKPVDKLKRAKKLEKLVESRKKQEESR